VNIFLKEATVDIHAKWINTYGNTLRFPDLGSDVEASTNARPSSKALTERCLVDLHC